MQKKNISHVYDISRKINPLQFRVKLLLLSSYEFKINMTIHSNKNLNAYYLPHKIENNMSTLYVEHLFSYSFAYKKIIFPRSSSFATYEYFIPNVSLMKENTIIFTGDNSFEPIKISLCGINNEIEHDFIISEKLIDVK